MNEFSHSASQGTCVLAECFANSQVRVLVHVYCCAFVCVHKQRLPAVCSSFSFFSNVLWVIHTFKIIKDNVVMKREKCLSLNQIKSFKKHAKEEAPNVISKRSKSEILQQFSFTQSFDTEINLHGNM